MALTLDDIMSQISSIFTGGNYQGNGVTTFAAPDSLYSSSSSPLNGNGIQVGGVSSGSSWNNRNNPLTGNSNNELGMNLGTAGLALEGLSALSNLFAGQQAQKLAKGQFNFTKSVTNTNLNNAIKSYNTTLEDRLRARGVTEGTDSATVQAQIDKNLLTR